MELKFQSPRRYIYEANNNIDTGNSTVFKAIDQELSRTVCIKRVHFDCAPNEVRTHLEIARREVRAMVQVGEATVRVPSIYDTYFDASERNFYIVMQWIKGKTLKERMEVQVSDGQFLQWMITLCSVMSIMEQQRINHKDIKPANIMIDDKGELFLIDFNISLNAPNLIEGTQYYRAPEMDGRCASPSRNKVDMFAVGIMMYEHFTGSVPLPAVDYASNSRRTVGNSQWTLFVEPKEKNPSIPDNINSIIVKCMKLDPSNRYSNAAELSRALVSAHRSLKNQVRKL